MSYALENFFRSLGFSNPLGIQTDHLLIDQPVPKSRLEQIPQDALENVLDYLPITGEKALMQTSKSLKEKVTQSVYECWTNLEKFPFLRTFQNPSDRTLQSALKTVRKTFSWINDKIWKEENIRPDEIARVEDVERTLEKIQLRSDELLNNFFEVICLQVGAAREFRNRVLVNLSESESATQIRSWIVDNQELLGTIHDIVVNEYPIEATQLKNLGRPCKDRILSQWIVRDRLEGVRFLIKDPYFTNALLANLGIFFDLAKNHGVDEGRVVLEMIRHPQFKQLPQNTLQDAFEIAAERRDMQSFSQLFESVSRIGQFYIDKAFILACKKNHSTIVEALSGFVGPGCALDGFNAAAREDALEVISYLLSLNSNQIGQVHINRAFNRACQKKYFKTVEVLFGYITPDFLSHRFNAAAEEGAAEVVSHLLSLNSNQIGQVHINRAFNRACRESFFKVIEALVEYVNPSSLSDAFLAAVRGGAVGVVSKLLSLKKDAASLLSNALMKLVKNNEMGNLSALTSNHQFAEIPLQEFVNALMVAAEGNYLDVLGKLSKTILFSELEPEDINNVINRALEFGNYHFAQAILRIAEKKCSEPESFSKLRSILSDKVNFGKNKLLIAAKKNDSLIFPSDFLQNQEDPSLWKPENLTNFTSDVLESVLSEAIKYKSSDFLSLFIWNLKNLEVFDKLQKGKLIEALVKAAENKDRASMSVLIDAGVPINRALILAKQKSPLSIKTLQEAQRLDPF